MPFSWRQRLQSFAFAWQGAVTLVRTQHNMWIHLAATAGVIMAGFFVGISRGEWALVVVAIGLVWMAEAFNTAIEFLSDEVSRERREGLGRAKDVAAFGVLCAAITAVVIGAVVFGPYVVAWWTEGV
ncbi:MAG: hypothetical protein B9S32_05950 [Verrucomicrobia bacterium Tous-C9LFEB]|nr:MAG: hypothetical protein B9S32_05950 [Verrucomicrobia bacterium Tous-C9LFEB]